MDGSPSLRSLARIGVIFLVLGQLVVAHAGALGGALAVTFLAHGHRHPLSLLDDGGHVDVVLHHDGEADAQRLFGSEPTGPGTHDGDHVVHVDAGEAAHKRSQSAPSLAAALTLARVAPVAQPGASRAPHAPAVVDRSTPALLRCTVLQI